MDQVTGNLVVEGELGSGRKVLKSEESDSVVAVDEPLL
jgi:hypothetical protein